LDLVRGHSLQAVYWRHAGHDRAFAPRGVHAFEARGCIRVAFKIPLAVPSFPIKAAWATSGRDGFEDRQTTAAHVSEIFLLQRMHLSASPDGPGDDTAQVMTSLSLTPLKQE
jgi:hypothetical protein